VRIILITGGAPHYEAGLIAGLAEHNVNVNVIGGDDLADTSVLRNPKVCFLNFYGKSERGTALWRKILRIITVYLKLMTHVATSNARLIHIQWHYKLPFLDRTVLNFYYKLLGKKLVFTAHNIDAAARDGKQSWANRVTLRFHYQMMDRIIVHTEQMKAELNQGFGIPDSKITVIPHGVMSAVPETQLTKDGAREWLGLTNESRVILAFGLIAPYKGLEYLVAALARLRKEDKKFFLVIAGRIKECQDYWDGVMALIEREELAGNVVTHLGHIPDESVEVFFKAADVLAMPYRSIFQSGVLFLAYRFGLPVIATDVGSLKNDLIEGKAGFVSKVDDSADLARTIEVFFASDMFANPEKKRREIREYASARYSWSSIANQTRQVYESVLQD
jgi:D-inositol-3-phosphate glycosyltransferase